MSFLRRHGGDGEVEALITDRYLDSLLAVQPTGRSAAGSLADGTGGGPIDDPNATLGAAVRALSRRLSTDLPRFHPSFRFEERLALRLAEVAASMRLPLAAGGEGQSFAVRELYPVTPELLHPPVDDDASPADRLEGRPLLIGGAVAASALSLAGAWLAWRRRPVSPMARAVRAAHHLRLPGAGA